MKKLIISLFLFFNLFSLGLGVLSPGVVYAQPAQGVCAGENSSFLGFPTWYKFLSHAPSATTGKCELNAKIPDDAPKILLAIFEIILRVSGLAAVGFVIYGGFQYLLSQGEPEQTKGAKSTILNAFIGLVITMLATAVVNIIGRNIA
jgi:hypothetical protein